MSRLFVSNRWSRAALLLLLPGCLVSFNDYPLGAAAGGGGAASMTAAGAQSSQPSSGAGAEADAGGASSAPSDENLIDDFEDDDHAILEQQGRRGYWYVTNDGRGMQTPRSDQSPLPSLLQPARAGSSRGLHTFGGPFLAWGALIGTTLASNGDAGLPYDLRPYSGLRVWVRSGGFGGANQVRINLATAATEPGGGCTTCGDHFGMNVALSAEWSRAEVPFSSLTQVGFGAPRLPEPELEQVLSIQFSFGPNVTFDVWIDDLELY